MQILTSNCSIAENEIRRIPTQLKSVQTHRSNMVLRETETFPWNWFSRLQTKSNLIIIKVKNIIDLFKLLKKS